VWLGTGTVTPINANAIVGVMVYAVASIVKPKTMSLNKSLKEITATAVKVEVVSTCVWSHTAPYSTICEFTDSMMFVHALLHTAHSPLESRIRTLYITTDENGWKHRFHIEGEDLVSLAAYQFVKDAPSALAKVLGIHALGFFRMKNEEEQKRVMDEMCRIEVSFNQNLDNGIRQYRMETISIDDPKVEESSTAADAHQFDAIKYIDKNQNS
jgi:hypothetical protein